ncbi:MAG: 2-dehydro-3-deoxyphosphooctonate aldolase [Cytophagia bacterium]|nr:2-dehydro-3-deoxyphosphooctonate aldolase [Cytophagia bacterium]
MTVKSQDKTIDESVIIEEISSDPSYGAKPKTNIKVGSVRNEYTFIAQLTGPNGEEITAKRLGSGWDVKSKKALFGNKVPLDKWEIKYEGLKEPIIIYLNGYDYEKPKCPFGLSFKKL